MTVVIPVIAFLLLLLCFSAHGILWRSSFLLAAVSWGVLLTAATELLSLCHGINRLSLAVFWSGVSFCALFELIRTRGTLRFIKPRVEHFSLFIDIGIILATTRLIAEQLGADHFRQLFKGQA